MCYVIICYSLCRSSGGQSPGSQHGGPGSNPARHVGCMVDRAALVQVCCNYFVFFLPLIRSTNCSTIIITYPEGLVRQANKWSQ
jgi:hypothetical protein